jgi:hypothetical protein
MFSGPEKYQIVTSLLPIQKYGSIFRLVDESDAEFIFKLRTNLALSRFINKVSSELDDQVSWIMEYKKREMKGEEFYFISINAETGVRQGLNRIYNFKDYTFELGSWLYVPDDDISRSILGDIAVREIAYDNLLFQTCAFEVRKANKSVVRYHQGYSPELAGEDEEYYYFQLPASTFNQKKNKYLNIFGYGYSR